VKDSGCQGFRFKRQDIQDHWHTGKWMNEKATVNSVARSMDSYPWKPRYRRKSEPTVSQPSVSFNPPAAIAAFVSVTVQGQRVSVVGSRVSEARMQDAREQETKRKRKGRQSGGDPIGSFDRELFGRPSSPFHPHDVAGIFRRDPRARYLSSPQYGSSRVARLPRDRRSDILPTRVCPLSHLRARPDPRSAEARETFLKY